MFEYKVIVKAIEDDTEPGAFQSVRLGENGYFEILETSETSETYTLYTETDQELALMYNDAVISYEVVREG